MKTLRHISGILLAAVGIVFLLGAISHVIRPDANAPFWMLVVILVILGILPLCAAFFLLRATLTAPGKSCPNCGCNQREAAGVLRKTSNLWLFHFGGWLFSSLWGASREHQVRCVQCNNLYLTDTKGTRIAGVIFWVILLLVILGVIAGQIAQSS